MTRVTQQRSGEPMSTRSHVTQRQVADDAGVSRTTVSLVLNQVPDQTYRDAFLPGLLLDGISRAARRYGYQVLFRPVEAGEPNGSYIELVRGRHTDGLILSGPRADDDLLLALRTEGFPIVLHGCLYGVDIPSVDVDNVEGAATAVNHLLALGHWRVALITNASLVYAASRQRLEGYRKAIWEAHISYDETLVREGNFDEESSCSAVRVLLALDEPPTAIFAASDTQAVGVLEAAREAGLRVPDDLSVVGYDDIEVADIPGLTTRRQLLFESGRRGVELLLETLRTPENRPVHEVLPTELIVRDTTAPPRG